MLDISPFDAAAILIVLAAALGYLNHRFLKLPSTVGLTVMGAVASLGVILYDQVLPSSTLAENLSAFLRDLDFHATLMEGMLSFLLFAGAMHVDWSHMRKGRWADPVFQHGRGDDLDGDRRIRLPVSHRCTRHHNPAHLVLRLRRADQPDRPGCGDERDEARRDAGNAASNRRGRKPVQRWRRCRGILDPAIDRAWHRTIQPVGRSRPLLPGSHRRRGAGDSWRATLPSRQCTLSTTTISR